MIVRGYTGLIVTKPTGEIVNREVVLTFDEESGLIEVVFIGESQLKGYRFGILEGEIDRIKRLGEYA